MFNDDFTIGEFIEGNPAARPAGYTDEALWRRIEQYIVWRWGERSVEWTVHGEGLFMPPLKPVTITAVARFNDYGAPGHEPGEWIPRTLRRTPFGVRTDGPGFYKIQGTAGGDQSPPPDVLEAYTRMADYLAGLKAEGHVGATAVDQDVPGVSLAVRRSAQAMARALEYSGAADILKAYRHV